MFSKELFRLNVIVLGMLLFSGVFVSNVYAQNVSIDYPYENQEVSLGEAVSVYVYVDGGALGGVDSISCQGYGRFQNNSLSFLLDRYIL